jgi:large subunit ribosomal protein L12
MEYIYGALLLHSAGKPIDETNVTAVLKAAGVEADPAKIKALTASLDGVNLEEAITTATSMPVAAAAPAAGAAPAAEKKEEKPEEKGVSEEEAAAGLGALFG